MGVQGIILEYHGNPSVPGRHLIDLLAIDVELAPCDLLKARDHAQRR